MCWASNPKLEGFINSLIEQGSHLGWTIIKAIIVFVVGRVYYPHD